jgi:hypothetical protein
MTHLTNKFCQLLCVVTMAFSILISTPAVSQTMQTPAANQLILPAGDLNINFAWQGDSLNRVWEPNAALLIPIKLPGCPKQLYMQFDLGAPVSMFYTSKVNEIKAKYPKSIPQTDSVKLLNQHFTIAGKDILAKEILLKKYGSKVINWKNKNSLDVIGTIGMDLIENKTIVFDYPGKKLTIAEQIPADLSSKITLTKFMFINHSILLPVVVNKKRVMLFFDTGSSAYELLTDKSTCLALATPGAQPVTHQSRSWDKMLTANIYPTQDSITIATQKLPLKRVTYMEGASNSQIDQMMKMGMGGMTGNKLFINSILVIDTRNKQFAVGQPSNIN